MANLLRSHASTVGALVPLLLMAVIGGELVHQGGAGWSDIALYAGYFLVMLTLPGVLIWRLLWNGERGSLLEHVIFGTLLAVGLQVPVYLLGVLVGFPRLTILLPVVTVLGCLASRRRREIFRPPLERIAPELTWAMGVVTVYALLWETRIGWRFTPQWGVAPANPTGDQQFHVALIGELRNHFPPTRPSVEGTSLHYHYFVNAHLAAARWWIDVREWLLLDRLLLPAMVCLVIAAVGLIAMRLSGKAWVGALAIVILGLVGDFSPFRWSTVRSSFDERYLAYFDPVSPSLQFSIAMLLLMVYVAMHVLRTPRRDWRDWLLLIGTAAVLPGSKGTAIALALAGMFFVLAVVLVFRLNHRRLLWILSGVLLVVFAFFQVVLFHGAAGGMRLHPFDITGYVAWALGLSPDLYASTSTTVRLFAGVGLILSWICSAAGALGFLLARGWRDTRVLYLAGIGAAGIAVALAFEHPHLAEDYFARTSSAPLAVVSAAGIGWLLRDRSDRVGRILVAIGLLLGLGATTVAALTAPADRPVLTSTNANHLVRIMLTPYLVVGALILVLAGVLWLLVRRGRLGGSPALAVLLATVVGLGLARVPHTLQASGRTPEPVQPAATASIGRGGIAAADWLRAHSGVDDLVATNAHYLKPGGTDNRHFWISALAQRRVYIEGWGYTDRIDAIALKKRESSFYVPFWDQAKLRANDRAFTQPSPESLSYLREHHVRWLFVDNRFPADVAGLREVAEQRLHRGSYWVFRLPRK